MDLTSKITIKSLLGSYNALPQKRFGQNFLIDEGVLEDIVSAADLTSEDIVLEVGPGIGTLTQKLARRAGRVIAIEKDLRLLPVLKATLKDFTNVTLIPGDILKLDLKEPDTFAFKNKKYKVVTNLPFYIATPVIRKFLETAGPKPAYLILTIQKEVAQRITAAPPDMTALAVFTQFYAKPELIARISKNAFWPQPKVDAAILKITPHSETTQITKEILNSPGKKDLFFKIVKTGFAQPRKQIINNLLRLGLTPHKEPGRQQLENWLAQNSINPTRRAQTLSLEEWARLTNNAGALFND